MPINTLLESGFNAPIKTWLPVEEIEPGALEQLRNAAKHPEVGPVVAAMPDTHVGFGISIGAIVPLLGAVSPNMVGVDQGCGMVAYSAGIKYDRETMDKNFWRAWSGSVARNVPTGFSWHKDPQDLGELDRPLRATELQSLVKEKAAYQLG